jgi:kynureninase
VSPALSGWLGHEAPFDFTPTYHPAPGIERMRVGTPPVIALAALESALDIWDLVTMEEILIESVSLTEKFIQNIESTCPMLTLASPRDPGSRGSQVSFRFADGYAAMQALIARGVIGDFRAPDIMRFGFTPLFINMKDVSQASEIISEMMNTRAWDRPEFKARSRVT